MTTPSLSEVLSALSRLGAHLEVAGDKLRFRPKGAVPPELVEVMRQRKAEILTALQSEHPAIGHGLCPGPDKCKGCYPIPGGRYIHPPKGKPISWPKLVTERVQ